MYMFLCSLPLCGQVTSYVNERGNVVFTNEQAAPAQADAATASAGSSGTDTRRALDRLATVPQVLDKIVVEAAEKHRVDPALVRALITAESNWNTGALSDKGAQGLMQLIPSTARLMGVANPFDPEQNVNGGVRYLRMLLERYNGDVTKSLAAYNEGPGAVDRFGGVPNYRETRDYVRKVTSTYYATSNGEHAVELESENRIYRATDSGGRLIFTNQ
jgi:soluble lytic murein transglycosylase-like protein